MRVAVFGATGVQGAHQVSLLTEAGHTVTAISRTAQPLKLHNNKTITTTAADISDPPALSTALQNIDTIFVNLPSTSFAQSGPILTGTANIATAAKQQNISHIIFNTSMPVPEIPQDIKAQDDRREMRRILRETGIPVISIQPVCYIDNLLEGWALPPIRDTNTLVYCHKPHLRVSWICHHDVAQLMVAAMLRPELGNRNFPVGGAETVVLSQLAEKLSRAWGRELGCVNQTVADFCDKISASMEGRGLESQQIVKDMFKAYTYYNEAEDEPFNIDMKGVLESLPVRLTPIEEWAKRPGRQPENVHF
ncbi:unnamed protein product [Periconia digitata]|uniref:NmrA-like domain-containing protein n=1 Tax=Periconia digitata TaxID=1303443 RepID=A0A9W4UG97_9PLEO|nr:unnamed protein product [Periconia digitata]